MTPLSRGQQQQHQTPQRHYSNGGGGGGGHPHHHHGGDHHDERSTGSSTTQLWDQLNDEEARQVRQHQSRFHPQPHDSRTNPFNIVISMAVGTVTDIQQRLQIMARDFQRRREWEERTLADGPSTDDGYFFQGQGRRRRRARQQQAVPGRPLNHPPPSAFDFDLQFGIDGLQPNYEENDGDRNDIENNNTNKPLQGYPFVMLHDREVPNRQAITNEREAWGVVANLDVFLQHLYQYYYHRGLVPMTCKFFVEMFSLLFTLWLSRVLFLKVDWKELATCKDETTCQTNWSDYYYYNINSDGNSNVVLYWIVQGYTLLILAYAAISTYLFWYNFQHAIQCRYILHDKLGLSERKLQGGALAWDTVVNALADHQQSGLFRTTALASTPLDPLSIAQRILRKVRLCVCVCVCALNT